MLARTGTGDESAFGSGQLRTFLRKLGARPLYSRSWVPTLMAAVAAACVPDDGMAQSCAMCYTSAAASTGGGIKALQHGILILLIPPLLVFAAICVAAFRRADRFANEGFAQASEGPGGRRDGSQLQVHERRTVWERSESC